MPSREPDAPPDDAFQHARHFEREPCTEARRGARRGAPGGSRLMAPGSRSHSAEGLREAGASGVRNRWPDRGPTASRARTSLRPD